MRTALRVALAAAALLASVTPSASAEPGELVLVCDLTYSGSAPSYDADGDCTMAGVTLTWAPFVANVGLDGALYSPSGLCGGLSSQLYAVVYGGPFPVNLAINRLGWLGAASAGGGFNGSGPAVFTTGPCSPGLSESVVIELTGL